MRADEHRREGVVSREKEEEKVRGRRGTYVGKLRLYTIPRAILHCAHCADEADETEGCAASASAHERQLSSPRLLVCWYAGPHSQQHLIKSHPLPQRCQAHSPRRNRLCSCRCCHASSCSCYGACTRCCCLSAATSCCCRRRAPQRESILDKLIPLSQQGRHPYTKSRESTRARPVPSFSLLDLLAAPFFGGSLLLLKVLSQRVGDHA